MTEEQPSPADRSISKCVHTNIYVCVCTFYKNPGKGCGLGILFIKHICRPSQSSLRWMACVVRATSCQCSENRAISPLMDDAGFCVAIQPD